MLRVILAVVVSFTQFVTGVWLNATCDLKRNNSLVCYVVFLSTEKRIKLSGWRVLHLIIRGNTITAPSALHE